MLPGAHLVIAAPNSASEEVRSQGAEAINATNDDAELQQKMLDGGFALVDVGYGADMDAFISEKAEGYLNAARSAGIIE